MTARARTHDPKTSWEAADKVNTNKLETLVLSVLKEHGANGATHDQVINHLEETKLWKYYTAMMAREVSISPRYAQLERKGLIYRDGTTRKGSMGRNQLVMYFKEKTS